MVWETTNRKTSPLKTRTHRRGAGTGWGIGGVFLPLPITKPYNSADNDTAKGDVDCLRKSQISQSLQHQLFLQAQCEMFSAPTLGKGASKWIKGLEMRRGWELGLPSLEEVQGHPALCADYWWGECRKQNWNILSAGTGWEAQIEIKKKKSLKHKEMLFSLQG